MKFHIVGKIKKLRVSLDLGFVPPFTKDLLKPVNGNVVANSNKALPEINDPIRSQLFCIKWNVISICD